VVLGDNYEKNNVKRGKFDGKRKKKERKTKEKYVYQQ
jgi:hypothetical protein